jgi:hypothetical protein
MQANRGWVCTGSRYAGKKMCARRASLREETDNKGMNIRNQNGFTVE